jgi:hypothetical protein
MKVSVVQFNVCQNNDFVLQPFEGMDRCKGCRITSLSSRPQLVAFFAQPGRRAEFICPK